MFCNHIINVSRGCRTSVRWQPSSNHGHRYLGNGHFNHSHHGWLRLRKSSRHRPGIWGWGIRNRVFSIPVHQQPQPPSSRATVGIPNRWLRSRLQGRKTDRCPLHPTTVSHLHRVRVAVGNQPRHRTGGKWRRTGVIWPRKTYYEPDPAHV